MVLVVMALVALEVVALVGLLVFGVVAVMLALKAALEVECWF